MGCRSGIALKRQPKLDLTLSSLGLQDYCSAKRVSVPACCDCLGCSAPTDRPPGHRSAQCEQGVSQAPASPCRR
jgi:hypothetical protein